MPSSPSLFSNKITLIVGLLVLSTVFYLAGISLERNKESGEAPSSHQETSAEVQSESAAVVHTEGAGEVHSEATVVAHIEGAGEVHSEATVVVKTETILGINLEAPAIVAAIVLAWIGLIVVLLIFKQRALPAVILATTIATVFDLIELVVQLNRNAVVALLAALVVITHVVVVILAVRVFQGLRGSSTSQRPLNT